MKIVYRLLVVILCVGFCALLLSCSFAPKFNKYRIYLPAFYADKSIQSTALMKGRHIVGFFNPDCPHCTEAAKAMHEIHAKNPEISFFMFIYCVNSNAADSTILSNFWAVSKAHDVPNACLDYKTFLDSTSGAFPQILWVNEGVVERRTDNNPLDEKEVRKWMK